MQRARNCSLQNVQSISGAHPASYSMGTGVSFPRVKQPGHGVSHLPPSSAKVKNEQSYTSNSRIWRGQGKFYLYHYLQYLYHKCLIIFINFTLQCYISSVFKLFPLNYSYKFRGTNEILHNSQW
jgi:hypothetical protein